MTHSAKHAIDIANTTTLNTTSDMINSTKTTSINSTTTNPNIRLENLQIDLRQTDKCTSEQTLMELLSTVNRAVVSGKKVREDVEVDSDEVIKSAVTAEDINPIRITEFVDGRNLACPMPLLKAKMALRSLGEGEYLYLVATDPNAQFDIQSYANHAKLTVHLWTSPAMDRDNSEQTQQDLFHFLIAQ